MVIAQATPVSVGVRNERPSQTPAYFCAGVGGVLGFSFAHAATTRARQSSFLM
jgi:hypothetical protein